MDPRIGTLNSGKFYAYVNGYNQEPFMGTLEQVEYALGLRAEAPVVAAKKVEYKQYTVKQYTVTLRFQYPSWSTVDGIVYSKIEATSKRDAIKQVRKMAEGDGHAVGGVGRYWFSAIEDEE